MFPLSSTHATELNNIGDVQRRRERVAIMEELSGFNYLLGRPQIQQLELEAALNDIEGVSIAPQGPIDLIGPSLLWAFGKRGGLQMEGSDDPAAMAKHVCEQMGIDMGTDPMVSLNLWAERQLLTGPDDHEDPNLLADGYDRQKWRDIVEKRVEQERYLVRQLDLDPKLRQGRLRDVVNARELEIELGHMVERLTAPMGTSITQLLNDDRAKARDFTDRMPSTRVAVSLKAAYHKDNRHKWTTNDIHDIDALSIAVPYCDAVFTDKAARNQMVRSPELEVFGTFLPRTPIELADWLDGLPPV
ncbi:hypothetical protein [Mycolicibacterium aubagnense]|uniref:Uncharacterized protein n=1 Tax=Mycolicibacterium aubagnense TaxID=319707 RepID=A0ABM7IA66_9MYCO|nr:hypothetical protein [Mycolicibacterium aubagnense]TLH59583.1 hypothetical protein C1S80_18935 [Mycolicibacterium aubagnense]WGI34572.1 hypothetical protein QDT91_09635 [Mycolicibacterium aubagnense]BBX83551.1 hypothetical protein MAUB_14240 [Mycolicibacterium aubagnense]